MGTFKEGDVFYYNSTFLNSSDKPHYHIVVLDNLIGQYGGDIVGVVIITSYTKEKEEYYRGLFGKDSYIVIDSSEYSELSHKSLVVAHVREEDPQMLTMKGVVRKDSISNALLEKIKKSALLHELNGQHIKRALR